MIRIILRCDASGEFRHCEATGHAGFATRGKDIVCSAVTIILRTAMRMLSALCDSNKESISFITEAASRGNLFLHLEKQNAVSSDVAIRLICIADFIREGITSVSKEYPRNVQISEETLDF